MNRSQDFKKSQEFVTARHEAAHAVLLLVLNLPVQYATIIPKRLKKPQRTRLTLSVSAVVEVLLRLRELGYEGLDDQVQNAMREANNTLEDIRHGVHNDEMILADEVAFHFDSILASLDLAESKTTEVAALKKQLRAAIKLITHSAGHVSGGKRPVAKLMKTDRRERDLALDMATVYAAGYFGSEPLPQASRYSGVLDNIQIAKLVKQLAGRAAASSSIDSSVRRRARDLVSAYADDVDALAVALFHAKRLDGGAIERLLREDAAKQSRRSLFLRRAEHKVVVTALALSRVLSEGAD